VDREVGGGEELERGAFEGAFRKDESKNGIAAL
jgi:hypothetical protein